MTKSIRDGLPRFNKVSAGYEAIKTLCPLHLRLKTLAVNMWLSIKSLINLKSAVDIQYAYGLQRRRFRDLPYWEKLIVSYIIDLWMEVTEELEIAVGCLTTAELKPTAFGCLIRSQSSLLPVIRGALPFLHSPFTLARAPWKIRETTGDKSGITKCPRTNIFIPRLSVSKCIKIYLEHM